VPAAVALALIVVSGSIRLVATSITTASLAERVKAGKKCLLILGAGVTGLQQEQKQGRNGGNREWMSVGHAGKGKKQSVRSEWVV
jgi:hypothetical protein